MPVVCTTLQHFIHQVAPRSPCDFSYTQELSFLASFAGHIYTLILDQASAIQSSEAGLDNDGTHDNMTAQCVCQPLSKILD